MVILPVGFTAIEYPGYFWNIKAKALYSIKVSGVLKELKRYKPNGFNHMNEDFYVVSVNGKRKVLSLSYLENLVIEDSEIEVVSRV